MTESTATRKRSILNRPGRVVLAIGIVLAGFLVGGWVAYAMPTQPRTHTILADTGATPTPVSTPTTTATPAPTPEPTVVPTVVPTVAPTPVPPPPQTVFTIAVPVNQQTRALNCETAALQMGLATYGYHYTQDALFARENADLRPAVLGPNHTVVRWGNPYTNFVGNVNGSESGATGYGVYYPVILKIAREIGLTNAYGGEGMAPATVYQALATGHAVEVWVESNWKPSIVGAWTSWDGRAIHYSFHEHAVTLSGVSPTQVRVNDPWHGTQYWISKATFETVWADFNNMAVVF